MSAKTRPFDAAHYLETPEDVANYLDAIFEDAFDHEDTSLIASALGDVARSRGMTAIAEETGLSRESLYRTLSEAGNPTLSTLSGVLNALGLRLSVKALERT